MLWRTCITVPLWGEPTGHDWIFFHKGPIMQRLDVSFVISLTNDDIYIEETVEMLVI